MAHTKEQLILYSAQQDNILPLTSACNVQCVFCSHHQNPRGVEVYGIGHRSLEEIEMTLEFIDPERKIVIGESVTRIMEGEPFLHPEIRVILRMIRERFPETMVQVTTNGTLLTDEMLDLLGELGQIELYISLNSATARGRQILMGESGNVVRSAIAQLRRRGIVFQGSIVAMPWIVGWEDLESTVAFLDEHGAETVRIFMPGFTAKAPAELRFDPDLPRQLLAWADQLQTRYRTPLTVEPVFLEDLRAVVEGVVAGSAAEHAGLKRGDEILAIDGEVPFSRVQAFQWLARGGKQTLRVLRGAEDSRSELGTRERGICGADLGKSAVYVEERKCDRSEETYTARKIGQNAESYDKQFLVRRTKEGLRNPENCSKEDTQYIENSVKEDMHNCMNYVKDESMYKLNSKENAEETFEYNVLLPKKEIILKLDKKPDTRSGAVFAYDVHPDVYEQVYGLIMRYRAKRTLLMASTLAEPLIRQLALRVEEDSAESDNAHVKSTRLEVERSQAQIHRTRVEVVAVPNRFYGGSIMAGGLLVVQDFLDCWAGLIEKEYDLVLVPGIFLDPRGVDLVGRRFSELEEALKIPLEMVEI